MVDFVVATGVADVRRLPDDSSELVTQALLNMPVYAGKIQGEWAEVKLVDYLGWMRLSDLAAPITKGFCKVGEDCGTPFPLIAVITATHTALYETADGSQKVGHAYLSTRLPLLDITYPARVQVALPGERTAWLERSDLEIRQQKEPYPRQAVEAVTGYARKLLGVPYLWGGTSWEGIDCSGFVQLCYRMGGYFIPRDADQQDGFLFHTIERPYMCAGDLIFFGSKEITHVGMALNDHEYIHAEGQDYNRVVINSFNPSDEHYYERLDQIVWSMKRVAEEHE
ncbi:MAG TPA: C40 family peptidase [Ktedonobacteraceae bacterium]|nr:C40 family peptidase [Ktedonobacteraceae bacterium]